MPDREKVKAELDEIVEQCRGMDYIGFSTITEHCQNILALLKEQEPKMVQSIRTVAYRTLGYCPSCGRVLDSYHDGNSGEHITHFCYNCGQAVKWDA